MDKAMELKRAEAEWEDKITASVLQHKTTLESAVLEHEKSMANLRHQFQKEEEDLKKKHAEMIETWNARVKKLADKEPYDITQISRDFEKVRCEKRLLEDKYRSLKEKYVQMKNDMKIAIERKMQSRARRKWEEAKELDRNDNKPTEIDTHTVDLNSGGKITNNNTDFPRSGDKICCPDAAKSIINRSFMSHDLKEALNESVTDNDPSSTDDQYNSLSSAPATESEPKSVGASRVDCSNKQPRISRMRSRRHKERYGNNILENVKTQLQELDEIEEKIPPTAHKDTFVRYPFLGPGIGTSAEVDFYRHRVLVEQEAVRAARECLLQQKRDLEARQNSLRANTSSTGQTSLQQQEHDLTEMEVSIHRTRALLGEKMIRLRLLGQTLDRLVQEPLYSPVSNQSKIERSVHEGAEAVETPQAMELPVNVLQNLENINSEIREIWTHLSKNDPGERKPSESCPPSVSPEKPGLMTSQQPSNRKALESRLNALKQWLDQPPPTSLNANEWSQLTL